MPVTGARATPSSCRRKSRCQKSRRYSPSVTTAQAERLLPGHRATDAPVLHLAQLRRPIGRRSWPGRAPRAARAGAGDCRRARHGTVASSVFFLPGGCLYYARDDDPVDRRPPSRRRRRRAGGGTRAARGRVDARPDQAALRAGDGRSWIGHPGRRPRGAPHRRSLPRGRSAARRRRRHLSAGLQRAHRHAARRRQYAGACARPRPGPSRSARTSRRWPSPPTAWPRGRSCSPATASPRPICSTTTTRGSPARDRIVIVLTGDPRADDPASPFRRPEAYHYSQRTHKIINAREHGARAILLVAHPRERDDLPALRGLSQAHGILAAFVTREHRRRAPGPVGTDRGRAGRRHRSRAGAAVVRAGHGRGPWRGHPGARARHDRQRDRHPPGRRSRGGGTRRS